MAQQLDFELLTSTAVVFRSLCTDATDSSVAAWDALPHIVRLVDSYLDGAVSSRWSIERACEHGFGLRMLKRLAAHEASAETSGSNCPRTGLDRFYRAFLASKALVAAIRQADAVDVVQWICSEYCPNVVPMEAMGEAAKLGRLCVLQASSERYPSVQLSQHLAIEATKGGRTDVLQWLLPGLERPEALPEREFCLQYAAIAGSLATVKWWYELECTLSGAPDFALDSPNRLVLGSVIVEGGHFEVARFLAEHGYPLVHPTISSSARFGNVAMLEWLHALDFTRGVTGWMDAAARGGHLEVCKWFNEHLDWDVCTAAAMNGAAESGRLEVLQWLHVNRIEGCTTEAINRAAGNGHLGVVQWLHENRQEGCTADAMNSAAENGHLEIVKWLHEHRSEGCIVNAMNRAAANGHLEVVKWLHTNRSEGCTSAAMDAAAASDHFHIAKRLHENRTEGCTTDAMDLATSLPMLEWLQAHRAEGCTSIATELATRDGNFEKLLFLQRKRHLRCTERTVGIAARRWHFEVFQWQCTLHPELMGEVALRNEVSSSTEMREVLAQIESQNQS